MAVTSLFGTTKELSPSKSLDDTTTVGSHRVRISKIKVEHKSFPRPSIHPGLQTSRIISLHMKTRGHVETISRMMDDMNASDPTSPVFEIVSVTHMGYATADQYSFNQSDYYTVFYRLRLRSP